MKKILRLMMASAVALGTFTACEDVPEPYVNPYDQLKPTEPEVVIEPSGAGTKASPWNVAAIIEACNGLADGSFLKDGEEVYATGVVIETTEVSSQYGNATYYISDDRKGSNKFYVYRGKLLDGASVENETDLQPGDSVTVCGKVKNYKGTMEFDQGNYLVFIKKGEGGGDTPALQTPGTAEKPLTVAEALAYIANLGTATSPEGYVKGKIVAVGEIDTGTYGNATYTISDDGTDATTLQVYRGYSLGGTKFKSANEIKAGDEVIVKGKLVNFKGNTPQFTQGSAIYSLNGKTSGGGDDTPVSDAKKVTIAEFNAAAESDAVWYELTGTVKNLKDGDLYGNFDLEDATGSVYVYGLLDQQGGEKKKFQELVAAKGIKNGSKLTIRGTRGSYNDKIEVMNAYFVSIDNSGSGDTPAPVGDAKKVTVAEFNAAAESTDVWYQLTGAVKNLKDGDLYGNFDLEDATGSVYVYGLLAEKGGAKKLFQELVAAKGMKGGSVITIIGNRGSYNDKIEVMNAYFVSIEGGSDTPTPTPGGDVAETGDNGNFEQWADGLPVNWKTASTAGNATLTQSTTAHGGSYSVQVGGSASANKRIGYKEMKLSAGTYTVKFYAKGLAAGGTLRPGVVPVSSDNKAGTYAYSDYVDNISTGDWQLVEASLEVPTAGTYSFVVMNQKKAEAIDILIDDFTVTLNGKSVIK